MPTYLASTQFLPIYQLLGAPLTAMVEAEALAAHATAEFIESVGFVKDSNTNTGSFGNVKTVTFTYKKQNINGEEETAELLIPVLSLVNIPLLQIQDASVEFNLKINEVVVQDLAKNMVAEQKVFPLAQTYLKDIAVGFNGTYAPTNVNTQINVDLKVKINVARAELPQGFTKLFQAMDIAASSKPISNNSNNNGNGGSTLPPDSTA